MNSCHAQFLVLLIALISPQSRYIQAQVLEDQSLDLTGVVTSDQKIPIAGAQVFIYTAKPREGTSTLCPYCYVDCAKSTTTDATGSFTLPNLDPTLQFRLLTVADGFKPRYNQFILPETSPVPVKLTQRNDTAIPRNRKTKGRITNFEGDPIVGAKINVEGIQSEKSIRWSSPKGMDPIAITDANGIFILTAETPFIALNLTIKARNYAPRNINGIESGKHHVMQLTEGATVRGRILKSGIPAPNLTMLLTGKNRAAGIYVGHFELATNTEGRFEFLNMPPNTDFYLTGKISDFTPHGSLAARFVATHGDGSLEDVGDLSITKGLRLAGQLIIENNGMIPPKTHLTISSEKGWDRRETIIAEDGRFELIGLPKDSYQITVQVPGYRFAIENPNINLFDGFRLEGKLNAHLDNFSILMKKGPQHTRDNLRFYQQTLSRNRDGSFRSPTKIPVTFHSPQL